MGRIVILPDAVADQIAAGEVVERPASVVKELVENALDAGARAVRVSVDGGGRTRIAVADDGHGMDRDDAVLAVERHATSKIRVSADLTGVRSYGFRGEALPAIASVSHLTLETAPAGGEAGTVIVVRGGRMDTVRAATRQSGTSITVERLFFNTPARRKFLRTPRTEARAAQEALAVLALARLDVAFSLESDGRLVLDAPRAADLQERVRQLFGTDLAEQLLPVAGHAGGISVEGLVQRPADARPAGRRTQLFVNGRPFRDPFIVRAAEAGYRGTIPAGARPSLLLRIELPGDQVDVNVHPAKLEVRFRDRFAIERVVEHVVRQALVPLAAASRLESGGDGPPGGGGWTPGVLAPAVPLEFFAPDAARPPERTARRRALQVFDTFLLLETPDAVAIIDQHSAHERVLFERTMASLASGEAAAQRLLLPATVRLAPAELEAVQAHRELLERIGYEAEPFGGDAMILHSVPNPHPRFDAQRCFEELAADLARNRFGALANRLERFAATFACRAAVKAGDPLDAREIDELLERLFACTLPPHDVHGRPSIVQLPRHEIQRRFGRA
ncbi:MAG TPA: DNA mismatch repair endonuclease MutL [Gemmatimonadales bacterium]